MSISEELKAIQAEILVASTDTVFSHKRRVETEKLLETFKIPMISDRTGELSTMLNVLNHVSGNSERGTFIISPDGIIKAIEVVTEPIGRSAAELLRKVKALDYVLKNPGQACPASRNTGAQTLTPSIKIAGHVGEELQ
jgi:peroxiredoxin (alkyl hydroperoxide reductase subunit C)